MAHRLKLKSTYVPSIVAGASVYYFNPQDSNQSTPLMRC